MKGRQKRPNQKNLCPGCAEWFCQVRLTGPAEKVRSSIPRTHTTPARHYAWTKPWRLRVLGDEYRDFCSGTTIQVCIEVFHHRPYQCSWRVCPDNVIRQICFKCRQLGTPPFIYEGVNPLAVREQIHSEIHTATCLHVMEQIWTQSCLPERIGSPQPNVERTLHRESQHRLCN